MKKFLIAGATLVFPLISSALDYPAVKKFATSNAYTDNRNDVKHEPYYKATRALDPKADFTIKIFFDDPGKTKIRELSFDGQKCPGSAYDDENFIGSLKAELQIFFASVGKGEEAGLPDPVAEELKSTELRKKKELAPPEGIRKMRFSRADSTCGGTAGGYHITLDIFPNL